MTKLWLVPSAKQRRDPCSEPPTDSTNYRKCISNFPSTWLAITTNKTKPFLTGQSWCVLKSGYTAGSPEQGFRRCFADAVNQSLISSARRLAKLTPKECLSLKCGWWKWYWIFPWQIHHVWLAEFLGQTVFIILMHHAKTKQIKIHKNVHL